MDYLDMGIAEIHSALVKKEVTPLELVRLALQKAKDNKENAFEYIQRCAQCVQRHNGKVRQL